MSAEPVPLGHKQLAQRVVDRLRAEILEGRLKPGEWLRQERLAHEHGVSHMPVREALRQLAAEGLVEHIPYRGVRVVQFSVEDVADLYACRSFIEGMAASYAAEKISDDEVAQLERMHTRMVACETPRELPEYRELNRRFHGLIFQASGRSYLVRTLAQLWAAFPTMLWSNIPRIAETSAPGRDEPDAIEHAEIVAAFRAHDGQRAQAAVRRHIESAGRALLEAMRRQS